MGKLYLPNWGDRFAGRSAWRLGYHSQRIDACDRPFEAMYRLQRKLGGEIGWDMGLARKPRGMWRRTYTSLWDRYEALAEECDRAFLTRFGRLF
ncbi:hypothetical protein ACFQ1E_12770 [Sphingomonas canadensis]|uniref:Uncharacterized protein n=1 Tax=Sphingomonas canadensis TaxID=1219257 RepID=A0ABW3H938_9SPHN|nr:hypothetical protein [Sphingomonas canadensis]MCW3836651.1 hypothetical protein [Sphingomonas canadensis]